MKNSLTIMCAALLIATTATAGEKPAQKLEDLTLQGVISKVEKKKADKTIVSYVLTTEDGQKVALPKSGDKQINALIDEMIDKNVTLKGQGKVVVKGDKKRTMLKKITEIAPADVANEEEMAEPQDLNIDIDE